MAEVTRRKFLAAAGAGSGGWLLTRSQRLAWAGVTARRLSQEETTDAVLHLVTMALLPPRHGLPDPVQLGVPDFARSRYAEPGARSRLERGLAAVAREVELQFGSEQRIDELTLQQGRELVTALFSGQVRAGEWKALPVQPFIGELRRHLADGYYSNPKVWQALGFSGRAQFIGHPDFREFPRQDEE